MWKLGFFVWLGLLGLVLGLDCLTLLVSNLLGLLFWVIVVSAAILEGKPKRAALEPGFTPSPD
ncbi:MAG: hypothetical protein KF760_30595 [Candidatus Eremiobacteraeota bacterium]|nr:hypothetical protein [Candidatus Eremiobacteraeota bacterium]MCW5868597.1 hypothetical protein [Candidatus Eremiobacteraeota bacterium]